MAMKVKLSSSILEISNMNIPQLLTNEDIVFPVYSLIVSICSSIRVLLL
jgi:hypothetical protein